MSWGSAVERVSTGGLESSLGVQICMVCGLVDSGKLREMVELRKIFWFLPLKIGWEEEV